MATRRRARSLTKNTIVFRSYKDPDENSSTLTKLKVEYVNTVKTGGLKIQKKAADGEELTGTYEFKVTFSDVGGAGLEKEPIEKPVTIDMSDPNNHDHTATITGIPVGTRYTIEEVKTSDDSRLQSVTVPPHNKADVINNMVEGEIVTGNYEDKDTGKKIYTTEVYANRIEFAGAKMVDRPPFPEDAEGFLEIPEGMEEEMPFR